MLAKDLFCAISLDSFSARIPGSNFSLRIKYEDCIVAGAVYKQAKAFFAQAESGFSLLPVRDVPYDRQDKVFSICLDGAEQDVYGKLRSILSKAEEFKAGTHRTHAWLGGIAIAMVRMLTTKSLGDEHLYVVSEQFRLGVAEKPFRRRVDRRDTAIACRNHDRIRRG